MPPAHVVITDTELVGFPATDSHRDTCWLRYSHGAACQQTFLFFQKSHSGCILQTEKANLSQLRCTPSANLWTTDFYMPIFSYSFKINMVAFLLKSSWRSWAHCSIHPQRWSNALLWELSLKRGINSETREDVIQCIVWESCRVLDRV